MKQKIKESSAGGHLDVTPGIYDRPGPDITSEELPNFEPIVPQEQVSVQLTVNRPPVDDPDFVPNSTRDLELSVAELSKLVPDDQVKKFYKSVYDIVEKMVDNNMMKTDEYAGEEVMETKTAKHLSKLINEVMNLEDMQRQFEQEFGSAEPDKGDPAPVQDGSATLEDIAQTMGFSGPSGAKNFIAKLLSRIKRFADVPPAEFDALIEFAAGEYIDLLESSKLIDAEDAEFMSRNKDVVSKLPSFKYFIFNALVLPAVKHLEKDSKKKVKVYLDKMALAQRVQDTVMNQLLGHVPRNDKLVAARITDEVQKGSMTPEQGADAVDKLNSSFAALQKIAQAGDDFAEIALEKYSSLSKSKLLSIMKRASEDPFVTEEM